MSGTNSLTISTPLAESPKFNPFEDSYNIAFTGAQGTGKSTLTKILAEAWQYPYHPEGAREVLKKHGMLEDHTFGNLSPEEKERKTIAVQKDILEYKRKVWSMPYCIADRCQVDALAYTQYWLNRSSLPEATALVKEVKDAVEQEKGLWDAVIVVPPNIPLEDDGVRSNKESYRDHIHYLILGILADLDYDNVWTLETDTLPSRIAEVFTILNAVKAKKIAKA